MKLFLTFLLLFTVTAMTQNDSEIGLLQQKFKSINDFTADFEQHRSIVSEEVTAKGKFFYKKENKYRIEFNNLLIISDGITSWNYNKQSNQVVISTVEDEPNSFSLKKIINEYPQKCDIIKHDKETINGISTSKIELVPLTSELNFTSAMIWYDAEYMIKKLSINDNSGVQIIFSFSNYKLNNSFDNAHFTFSKPSGSKVIDLR